MVKSIKCISLACIMLATGSIVYGAQAENHGVARIKEPRCLFCSLVDSDDDVSVNRIVLCNGMGKIVIFNNWDEAIAERQLLKSIYAHFLHISCIQKILKCRNSCPGCGNHFSSEERRALLAAATGADSSVDSD